MNDIHNRAITVIVYRLLDNRCRVDISDTCIKICASMTM